MTSYGTYFSYFVTNVQGSQFSCFTQSGEEKEYDGTLSAEQGYVVITDESTTNGVHKYRIGNNGNFNGDNGDYSKWESLPTYTLPSGAVEGNTYSHIEYGEYIPLTDYHGQTVDGQIYCNWHWDIKTVKTITIKVSISVNGYNNNGHVAFSCSVSGYIGGTPANNTLVNGILGGGSISLSWRVVTAAGPFGSYTTSITSTGSLILNTGANYVNGTQYYIDMGDEPSCSPSSGTYNDEYNWDTYVSTATN